MNQFFLRIGVKEILERVLYLTECFCAVAEDHRLTEYIPVRKEDRTGLILVGKVNRIMSGLEAAFVDIGGARDGFLPLKENSQSFQGPPIHSGDRILVQIRREETGGKGAYLSRDLSIPGSYLILMPMNRHIGVSARIQDEETRKQLMLLGKELAFLAGNTDHSSEKMGIDETPHGQSFGLILRESALSAEKDVLLRELSLLLSQWESIRKGEFSPAGPDTELIRDYTPRGIDRILRDVPLSPDLERQRKESLSRTIRLPHGGNIVIDRCEALTVIDVNSASDSWEGSRRETTLRTNLEACREIMIQTRLRNLSGILIIDFIDMLEKEDQSKVIEALEEAFRQDRIKTVIHGYTNLGLMEMTRKRSRSPWQEHQST